MKSFSKSTSDQYFLEEFEKLLRTLDEDLYGYPSEEDEEDSDDFAHFDNGLFVDWEDIEEEKTPPPIPEEKISHENHKVVWSMANGESFKYCRDCKVEVFDDEDKK